METGRLLKLLFLIIIGFLCYLFYQSEIPHVLLEMLKWCGEGLEHVRV